MVKALVQNRNRIRISKLFSEFFKTEKASGIVLIFCTVISLFMANSTIADLYLSIWQFKFLGNPFSYWINDALMALFFLLVGLEIEREIYIGELSKPRNALLPIIGAIGGMTIPAGIHFALNNGTPTQAGIAIPMATDIAFTLGVLSLVGTRVPVSLKIFIIALAIIDDLGAIIVIALFYSGSIYLLNLLIAAGIIIFLVILNRSRVHNIWIYAISGIFLWYFIHESGIHATISGVIMAFVIPFGKGDSSSPSYRLQHNLHYLVAFIVLPIFALANTCLPLKENLHTSLLSNNSVGIILGLVAGKVIGISLFSYLIVKMKLSSLPAGITWGQLISISILAGIGFTMSIFISLLAFNDPFLIDQSKIAILLASVISGLLGYFILRRVL